MSAQAEPLPDGSSGNIIITVVGAKSVFIKSIIKREPKTFVRLNFGEGKIRDTALHSGTSPIWNQKFPFIGIDQSAPGFIEIFDRCFGRKSSLGRVDLTIKELFQRAQNKTDIDIKLSDVSLTVLITHDAQVTDVESAVNEIEGHIAPPPVSDSGLTVSASFEQIIRSLSTFMDIADDFSKIHPYVHAAWKIVSSAYRIISDQLDREDKICTLVDKMKSLLSCVSPLDCLRRDGIEIFRQLEGVVQDIMKQTVECVVFLHAFSGHGTAGKAVQAIRDSVSATDQIIQEFCDSFDKLAERLDLGTSIQTTLVSLRMKSVVEELALRVRLNPVDIHLSRRTACYPNTRLDYFETVVDWVFNAAGGMSNIFWLHGLAGSGKSAMSTTLANYFFDLNRLGAFISFDRRGREEDNDPFRVIHSLAFQLSQFDQRIREQVLKATDGRAHEMALNSQFQHLVKAPVEQSTISEKEGPIVIIIDALDECGSADPESSYDRGPLLSLLADVLEHLPLAIRIIITSRVVPDIKETFEPMDKLKIHIVELMVSTKNKDISIFVRQRLKEIAKKRKLSDNWADEVKIQTLVERAEGLFIWAVTACKLIDNYKPEKQLNYLVDGTSNISLDELYRKALDSIESDWTSNPDFEEDYRSTLGLILAAKAPLTPPTIDVFSASPGSFDLIQRLGSVLHCHDEEGAVQILHVSFREFLSDQAKCVNPRWFIDVAQHNQRLAMRCLEVLGSALSVQSMPTMMFNEFPINNHLDEPTIYACSYWVTHVCDMKNIPNGFSKTLYGFLSKHLLQWLETMSIMKKSRSTARLLEQLHGWILTVMPAESELSEIVYDGSRFAAFFCDTIAAHPSLVTLSALPFAPVGSKVYQLFHQGRADLPSVLGGYQRLWSPSFRVLHIPRIHVNSLAFSEDGSKIAASVSQAPMFNFEPNVSHSLHIWDVSTGTEDVAAAATDGGCVVAFTENGKKLLSASQTGALSTLNTETGKVTLLDWTHFPSNADPPVIPRKERSSTFEEGTKTVKDSMEERKHTSALDLMDSRVHHGTTQADHHHKTHNHYIVRAAFSPNGSTVVLGSQDGTLRVIDIAKGKELFPQVADMPLDSRAGLRLRMFHSISFSPDGLRFASASGDGGINVRDAKTGQLVFPKLEGHTGEVTALKFLTDMILSSAEADLSIRAWNAVTGTAMVLPAIIHSTDDFQPLDFSPDGRSLASTSKEGTIHIWDTALGKDLGPVLQGHFNQVSSVAFSSDAAKLVSGAFINPLQVWDVSHVRNYTSGMDRMKRAPHTIKFSPDGLLVESRRPEELKFWDTVTGKGLDLKAHSLSARFANEGSNVVLPPDSTPIGLLDSQRSEWHKPVESDHVSHLASSPKPETARAITCSDEGIVSVSGKAVWRLPLELKHRCCAIRNNYIAFGTWDCHVFVVHLPDYLLNQ